MSKCILLSIKPQHVANILNGLKTLEIRKKFPKDYVGWVYIYCTKNGEKPYDGLVCDSEGKGLVNSKLFPYAKNCPEHDRLINGKVVARFWCDKVEEIYKKSPLHYGTESIYKINDLACLTDGEIHDYLQGNNGYAIHITKLEIFDKPKEISEFGRIVLEPRFFNGGEYYEEDKRFLTRAPQSYCYIEV